MSTHTGRVSTIQTSADIFGSVLSDCVCVEIVKFPEDLFEETIHGVPLSASISLAMFNVY